MARAIEIKGRARYLVVGAVLVLLLGGWLAPSLLSQAVGSGGRGFSWFRGGYAEQHKTNLTGHWIGTAKGTYRAGFVMALEGEQIVVNHDLDAREGDVVLRLWHYDWSVLPDIVWSENISRDRDSPFIIDVPATGLYQLRLSYFSFAGSVVLDWDIR